MINSLRRHEVLSSLGVRQWYGKYSLSNAAASPRIVFSPISSMDPAHEVLLAISSNKLSEESSKYPVKDLVCDVAPLLEGLNASTSESVDDEVVRDVSVSVVDKSTQSIQQKIKKISLSLNKLDNYFVIHELNSSGVSSSEDAFLESVILVLSGGKELTSKFKSILSWPVFESQALFSEQEVYYTAVFQRWLESQSWSECDYLIYIGASYDELKAALLDVKSTKKPEAVVLHFEGSLNQVMTSSGQKKRLWTLLSGLDDHEG